MKRLLIIRSSGPLDELLDNPLGRWALTVLAVAGLMLAPPPSRAEVYGYLEGRLLEVSGAGPDVPDNATTERFRPTLVEKLESVEGVSITVTPEFKLTQEQGRAQELDEVEDYLTVERLYADVDAGPARIRLGRQALNWGSALIWNPTDVFQEVFLADYWAEHKGLNALRVYFPMPEEARLTVAAATGDTVGTDNRYAVKASLARFGADFSAVWMDDAASDRQVWGLDVKGTAVLGYWVEAAMFAPKDRDQDGFEQVVLGLDYSFPLRSTLYLAGQYYYDGSGQSDPDRYNWMALLTGERSTLARQYLSLTAMLAWNPDLSFTVNTIYNLVDSTALVTPYATAVYKDFKLSAGVNLTAGPEGGEFRPDADQDPLDLMPAAVYYLWARWYF